MKEGDLVVCVQISEVSSLKFGNTIGETYKIKYLKPDGKHFILEGQDDVTGGILMSRFVLANPDSINEYNEKNKKKKQLGDTIVEFKKRLKKLEDIYSSM